VFSPFCVGKETHQECTILEDGTTHCLDAKGRSNNGGDERSNCEDTHENCQMWADSGECMANPPYMLTHCRSSCQSCGLQGEELEAEIEHQRKLNHVGGDETLLETPYGKLQDGENDPNSAIHPIVANYSKYMDSVVFVDEDYKDVKDSCKNRHELCAFWASLGECENNEVYMQKHCAVACHSCIVLDYKHRCPVNPEVPMALNPGDLQTLFSDLMNKEEFQQYQPKALVMPNPPKESDIKDGPWIVTFDSLLTEEECDRMIELGGIQEYKPSADVGQKKFDGTYDSNYNSGRTSHNAWCVDGCWEDPVTQRVHEKIEHILSGMVPRSHYEYLQLLRYEKGQHYQTHHDYIEHHVQRQHGVRTLTVFLYLTDVEEGGGTNFPNYDLVVTPKKGKAVIWPSVLNEDPNAKDDRTEHGALPVIAGTKYAANAWIHQRDFKEVMARGCVG